MERNYLDTFKNIKYSVGQSSLEDVDYVLNNYSKETVNWYMNNI